MECKYCGAELPEGETLCPECGKAVEETPKEETKKRRKEKADAEEAEAQEAAEPAQKKKASRSIRAAEKKAAQAAAADQAREAHAKKRRADKHGEKKSMSKRKKIALISGAAVAVVLAILIPLLIWLNMPAKFILYEKGSELYISLYKDGTNKQLTQSLSNAMSSTQVNYLKDGCVYCEKTGVLYYLDYYLLDPQYTRDVVFHLFSVDLHVKHASELTPKEVAKFITDFSVTPDGKYAYYMTEYGQVYRVDTSLEKDPVKICENAAAFDMLRQGSRQLCFVTFKADEKGNRKQAVYNVDNKDVVVKMSDEVQSYVINQTAGMAAYATDDGNVYTVKNGKNAKRAAASAGSGVTLVNVTSDARVYYTALPKESLALSALINDDLAASDAAIKEGDDGYAKKQIRDRIRTEIKTAPLFDESVGTLWTAKGGKKASLAEQVGYTRAGEKKAADKLIFGAYSINADYKIGIAALAEALGSYSAQAVRAYLLGLDDVVTDFRLSLAIDGESAFVTSMDPIAVRRDANAFKKLQLRFAPNGKALYYIVDPNTETGAGTLTCAKLSGKTVKETETLGQKVLTFGFTENGKVISLRSPVKKGDAKTGAYIACELYVGDKKADDNAVYYESKIYDDTLYQYFNAGGSKFYYPVNHFDGNTDDFRFYNGSSSKDVTAKVHAAAAKGKNEVFFLDHYDTASGTLEFYNGRKQKQMDSFVQNVFCAPETKD